MKRDEVIRGQVPGQLTEHEAKEVDHRLVAVCVKNCELRLNLASQSAHTRYVARMNANSLSVRSVQGDNETPLNHWGKEVFFGVSAFFTKPGAKLLVERLGRPRHVLGRCRVQERLNQCSFGPVGTYSGWEILSKKIAEFADTVPLRASSRNQ